MRCTEPRCTEPIESSYSPVTVGHHDKADKMQKCVSQLCPGPSRRASLLPKEIPAAVPDNISRLQAKRETQSARCCDTSSNSEGDAEIESRKLPGQLYFTAMIDGETKKEVNLNCKVPFAEKQVHIRQFGNLIVCRHLALQEICERQAEDDGRADPKMLPHRSDRRAEKRGAKETMQETMSSHLENRFWELVAGAAQHYIVDHSQWGDFFHKMFSEEGSDCRYMLLMSCLHVMSVRLRVKQDPLGQPRYVINFYDPNKTITEARVFADDLDEIGKLKFESFFTPGEIMEYYGIQSEHREKYSHFIIVPNDFYDRPHSEPRDYETGEIKSVQMFLPDEETIHPSLISELLISGLPLTKIETQLNNCTSEQAIRLLSGMQGNQGAGLFQLAAYDRFDAMRDYHQLLLVAMEKGLIDAEQKAGLMSIKDYGGRPIIYQAVVMMPEGSVEEINGCGRYLQTARQNNWITDENVIEWLAARDAQGTPAVHSAMISFRSCENALEAYGEILLTARRNNRITGENYFDLLAARDAQGTPALYSFFNAQRTPALYSFFDEPYPDTGAMLKTYGTILLKARDEGLIDSRQLIKLLTAVNHDGTTGLFMAIKRRKFDEINVYGEILSEAMQKGFLSSEQVIDLLLAEREDNMPWLFEALQKLCPGKLSHHGRLLSAAVEKGFIENSDLKEMLAAKHIDGDTPGFISAIEHNPRLGRFIWPDSLCNLGEWL